MCDSTKILTVIENKHYVLTSRKSHILLDLRQEKESFYPSERLVNLYSASLAACESMLIVLDELIVQIKREISL